MSSTLLRPSTARSACRALTHAKPASTTFTRGKATVPDLPCNPPSAINYPSLRNAKRPAS